MTAEQRDWRSWSSHSWAIADSLEQPHRDTAPIVNGERDSSQTRGDSGSRRGHGERLKLARAHASC